MKEITKESIVAETELAFEFYDRMKEFDPEAKYRIFQIVERLHSRDRMAQEIAQKEAWLAGQGVPRLVP